MNSSADSLKRSPQRFSVLLIGSTGDGKSATINHLLNTDTLKTGSSEPETRATVEYLVNINHHDNADSDLELGIIDTPGFNDPRGIKQDACNLNSMKHFLDTHPLYSETKCFPNLIFLVISANEHRIDGSSCKLANTLRALKDLDVVDRNHPNVVAVLTFCCSISYHNVWKWERLLQEKKATISRNIHQALKIQAPVVLLENEKDSNSLAKSGDFTLLPNKEQQPKNLYEACQTILKENGDHIGLSTFSIGLAQNHGRKKQYTVADFKVKANDSTINPISEVEQDLLNMLRGSAEDGKDVMRKITGGRKKPDSREYPVVGWVPRLPGRLFWYMWSSFLWLVSRITRGRKKPDTHEYSVVDWVLRLPGCLLWYTWSLLLWLGSWVFDTGSIPSVSISGFPACCLLPFSSLCLNSRNK